MEQLKKRHKHTQNALDTLKESINRFKRILNSQNLDEIDTYRDSMIKRFEFTIELTWKYLKLYLEKKVGAKLEHKGPKPTFKYALQYEITSEAETTQAFQMLDNRNRTSHMYKEEIADQMSQLIPGYYDLMQGIIDKTKP